MKIKISYYYIGIIFFLICSCNNTDKYLQEKIWYIDRVIDRSTEKPIGSCFKFGYIFFKKDSNIVIPGFEVPIDDGKYHFNNNFDLLTIQELNDCYFNSTYTIEFEYASNGIVSFILKDERLIISCKRQDFNLGRLDINLSARVLDTLSWKNDFCIEARERICKTRYQKRDH